MDFTLSKKHEMARQLFKEFAENEVKPLAQEVDETEPVSYTHLRLISVRSVVRVHLSPQGEKKEKPT